MLKSEIEQELASWKTEVEKSLKFVEGKSYDIIAVKQCVAILLELVGRPNPPSEEDE
jgi:hypothetical protein